MSKLRIAVLRGGPCAEYNTSLKTGAAVLQHLDRERYQPIDVFIDREGAWHVLGLPKEPIEVIGQTDVVFNALHGRFGEDGSLQRLLNRLGVAYTGSDFLGSTTALHKGRTKEKLRTAGIRTPRHVVLSVSDDMPRQLLELFRSFPQPSIVKPVSGSFSHGVTYTSGYHEFIAAIEHAFEYAEEVLIEEFIRGKEVSSGVIRGFRGIEHYSLIPVEIVLPEGHLFHDKELKHSDGARYLSPSTLSAVEKEQIGRLSQIVHQTLDLGDYSRSDFIVTPKGIYFLEVDTLPPFGSDTSVHHALEAAGCQFPQFLDHVISLARAEK